MRVRGQSGELYGTLGVLYSAQVVVARSLVLVCEYEMIKSLKKCRNSF